MKRDAAVWTTRDGREIPVREMSDDHLINSIRFVERQFVGVERFTGGMDMWGIWCEDDDYEPPDVLRFLQAEARKRGLRKERCDESY